MFSELLYSDRVYYCKTLDTIKTLVAEDARFVDENSVISRSALARYVSTYSHSDYSLSGIQVEAAGGRAAIVSYKVKVRLTINSMELPVINMLATSVWVNEEGRWRLKHHHASSMPHTKSDP